MGREIEAGRLPETENKRICPIFGLKMVKKFGQMSLTREVLKQYLTEKHNGYLQCGRLRHVPWQPSPVSDHEPAKRYR